MSLLSPYRNSDALTVADVERILREQLGAEEVSLLDAGSPNSLGRPRKLNADEPIATAADKQVEVRAVFRPEHAEDEPFQRIRIRGEPLSETIIRERR